MAAGRAPATKPGVPRSRLSELPPVAPREPLGTRAQVASRSCPGPRGSRGQCERERPPSTAPRTLPKPRAQASPGCASRARQAEAGGSTAEPALLSTGPSRREPRRCAGERSRKLEPRPAPSRAGCSAASVLPCRSHTGEGARPQPAPQAGAQRLLEGARPPAPEGQKLWPPPPRSVASRGPRARGPPAARRSQLGGRSLAVARPEVPRPV